MLRSGKFGGFGGFAVILVVARADGYPIKNLENTHLQVSSTQRNAARLGLLRRFEGEDLM